MGAVADDRSRPVGDGAEPGTVLQSVLQLAYRARPALARRLGVSTTEAAALEHVMLEPMGPVELSRRLDMTSAAATVLVRRLESAGHLVREPHPDDRRRTVLHATAAAATEVFAHLQPFLDELDSAAAELDDEGRRAVTRYLRRVEAALTRLVGPDPPA